MIFLINFDVFDHSNFKYITLLYLNVFMYLVLLIKYVFIFTKLLFIFIVIYYLFN
jgi:hypothetical protein